MLPIPLCACSFMTFAWCLVDPHTITVLKEYFFNDHAFVIFILIYDFELIVHLTIITREILFYINASFIYFLKNIVTMQ